jgi:hypothetical protein
VQNKEKLKFTIRYIPGVVVTIQFCTFLLSARYLEKQSFSVQILKFICCLVWVVSYMNGRAQNAELM